ncbi:MAG: ComF family protein [Cellvibrionaceae bacterium]|nr:ComF family protein [Cellvibrionaceae bacterium]
MNTKIRTLYRQLSKDYSLKHHCILCDQHSSQRLCNDCFKVLARPTHSCQCCGLPMAVDTPRCGECLRQTPAYDNVCAPFLYQAPLSQLIITLKNQGTGITAKVLGALLRQAVTQYYAQHSLRLPDAIMPIPLHWQRRWQRGFNQAEILSRALSRKLMLPHYNLLQRVTQGDEQKNLKRRQRLRNLQDSFTLQKPSQVAGKSIALVDDVMTTGATANTVAKCLKHAGADTVSVWVLARTPFNKP